MGGSSHDVADYEIPGAWINLCNPLRSHHIMLGLDTFHLCIGIVLSAFALSSVRDYSYVKMRLYGSTVVWAKLPKSIRCFSNPSF